jgi:hypothetical protein
VIVQAVMDLVVTIFSAAFGVLPTASLSGLFVSVDATMTSVGGYLASWNVYLPLAEVLTILSLLLGTWLPAVLVYKLANWAWRHFPDIAGFGPGAG